MVCHAKCAEKLPKSCIGSKAGRVEVNDGPLRKSMSQLETLNRHPDRSAPSMFGKELSEQIAADNAPVPVLVTKCIYAVEAVGTSFESLTPMRSALTTRRDGL